MNMTGTENLKDTVDGQINFPFKAYAKERVSRIEYLFNDDYENGLRPSHMSNGTVVDDAGALNGKALRMPQGYGISNKAIVAGNDYVINLRVRHDEYSGFRYFHIGPTTSTGAGWAQNWFGMLLANPSNNSYWNRKVYLPYSTGPIRSNPGGYVTMRVELTYLSGTSWTVKEYYQEILVSTTTKSFGTIRMTWYASYGNVVHIDSFSIAKIPR